MQLTNILASSLVGLLGLATISTALPTESTHRYGESTKPRYGACKNPAIRKEWRTLSTHQQDDYVRSVKCLMHSPGKLQALASGVKTRWEDFIYIHQIKMPMVHNVGQFLPFHRLYLYEYERVLRSECDYAGYLPYWDAKQDGADIVSAPIFSPSHGFGGNGAYDPAAIIPFLNITADGGGCLFDGPFAGEVIHTGHEGDTTYHERCIKRNFLQLPATRWFNAAAEQDVLASETYERFAVVLEGDGDLNNTLGIHNAGHLGVGGDMLDQWASPSDPIFFVHHANIDRIWSVWQSKSSQNQWAIGNPIASRNPLTRPLWPDAPMGNVTLGFRIDMGPMGSRLDVRVEQVMDTRGSMIGGGERGERGLLCYRYE